MKRCKTRWLSVRNENGAVMTEMALMMAFIAMALISGVQSLTDNLSNSFKVAGEKISGSGGFDDEETNNPV